MQEIKRQFSKLSVSFQSVLVVLIASLFVVTVLYATTTIGTNISTEGTLTVSGLANMTDLRSSNLNASGTPAFANIKDYGTLDVSNGLATFSDLRPSMLNATSTNIGALRLYGNATTSGAFGIVIGSETTTGTTTLKIKADTTGANGSSCIEMMSVEGSSYAVYVTGAGALRVDAGTCK